MSYSFHLMHEFSLCKKGVDLENMSRKYDTMKSDIYDEPQEQYIRAVLAMSLAISSHLLPPSSSMVTCESSPTLACYHSLHTPEVAVTMSYSGCSLRKGEAFLFRFLLILVPGKA